MGEDSKYDRDERIYFALQCWQCDTWQNLQIDFVVKTAYQEDEDIHLKWWVSFKKYIGQCPNCQAHIELDLETDREQL